MVFTAVCTFQRTPVGMMFMPASGAPNTDPRWCELRASLQTGEETSAPRIVAVEMRSWGRDFATDVDTRDALLPKHWRHLDGEALNRASGFLVRNFSHEMGKQARKKTPQQREAA